MSPPPQLEPREVAQVILADGAHDVDESSFDILQFSGVSWATWTEHQKMRDSTARRVFTPVTSIVAITYGYR